MKNEDSFEREISGWEQPSRFPNLLQIGWRHKALIALGVVVGLVIGSFYFTQKRPVYNSTAQVLVTKKRPDALPVPGIDVNPAFYEDYLTTHQTIIRSPVVIGQAVTKHGLQSLPSFAEKGDPIGQIRQALTVVKEKEAGVTSSNILEFSFKATNPEDCQAVVEAVIDSYREFLDTTYGNVSMDTVKLVTQAAHDLRADLSKQQVAYQDFRKQSDLMWKGKEGINFSQEEIINIQTNRLRLGIRKAEIEPRLAVIKAALKDGRSSAALFPLASDTSMKTGVDSRKLSPSMSLEDAIVPVLLQEKENPLQGLGPNHPAVIAFQKRIEMTRGFFPHEQGKDAKTTKAGGPGDKKTQAEDFVSALNREIDANKVSVYIQALNLELEAVEASEKKLSEMFEAGQKGARRLSNDALQDELFQKNLTRTEAHYDAAIKRLSEVNLIKDLGGYDARVITPAVVGWRVEPNPFLVFPIAGFAGLLGGFGLSYLVEVSDKSFRTPEEVRSRLGLPLLGHIPAFQPEKAVVREEGSDQPALDPMLCSYYRARTREAEAYRGVRTALYFSTHGQGHKVIQITSPDAGDGKSTLAANLAVSIAQSGKSVLLIDADFRRPRIHTLFGLPATFGLASVIQGQVEMVEAIHHDVLPNLSVLGCGPVPVNPADLLTSRRFEELLGYIRDQYEFVLLDTPPVLAVSDPCVVAPRVDGILLTIRISKHGRPPAERTKEILATVGAKVLGVVVNRLNRQSRFGAQGYHDYYREEYGHSEKYYASNGAHGATDGEQVINQD